MHHPTAHSSNKRSRSYFSLLPVLAAGLLSSTVLISFPGSATGLAAAVTKVSRPSGAGPLISVNGSKYSVSCTGASGKVSISPGLKPTEALPPKTVSLKFDVKLSGCTATPPLGSPHVTVTSGTLSGTVTHTGNGCDNILSAANPVPLSGSLAISWVTSPALTSPKTVLTARAGNFPVPGSGGDTDYVFPTSFASGAFDGPSTSAGHIIELIGSDTPNQLGLGCISTAGLTNLPIHGGYSSIGGSPSSISVTPTSATVTDDGSFSSISPFSAVATYAGGHQVNVTFAAKWSSSNIAVAVVVTSSFVGGFSVGAEGKAAGPATISAALGGRTNSAALTVVNPLQITTASLPDATIGTSYDQPLAATGGTQPYMWSLAMGSLPDGLSLDPTSGVISGTPASDAVSSSFTVQVSDSSSTTQYYSADLSINVTA